MNRKVLFVDDEVNILKSLKRQLYEADFEVITANSALQALEILSEDREIGIVISDVKMPGMDGLQLLTAVKLKYPHINRIILSGYVDESTIFKSILKGVATAYFIKPWKAEILVNKIDHIFEMRDMFADKQLLKRLNQIKKLPVMPKTYQQVVEAIEGERSNGEIAEIIRKDPAISTQILSTVNSAYFGLTTITSIERAITMLGLNLIKDILLTMELISDLDWDMHQQKYLEDIMIQSVNISKLCKILHLHMFNEEMKPEFSSIGITHNIGKIILLQYFFDHYKQVITYVADNPGKSFYECEMKLGLEDISHTKLGAYLLNIWNLHDSNIEAAFFHHTPLDSSILYRDVIKCLNLATILERNTEIYKRTKENSIDNLSDFEIDPEALAMVMDRYLG